MKKKVSLIVLLGICLITLTGCLSKKVMSTDDFTIFAESKEMKVVDAISQYEEYEHVTEATIALAEAWQVEFYVLVDEDSAIGMYDTNVAKFEARKQGASSETSAEMLNYDSYSLTTGGNYMYVSRVENTIIYVDVEDEYKEDVKTFIEEMGY